MKLDGRRKYASLYERLVANTVEDDDGCWIWTGRVRRHYPAISVRDGKKTPISLGAHRAMLEETLGWYFPHDHAGHWRCFKPLCIRPDCLRIETIAENLSTRRGYAPSQGSWIPVLYPTPARLAAEAIDHCIDNPGPLQYPHDSIPF